MVIRKIEKHEKEIINEIIENEIEIFGENGAVDIWNLKPLVKYGKVYGLFSKENLISWIQLISDWEKEKIYIYGIATKKEFAGKGYAKKLMIEIINNCLDDFSKPLPFFSVWRQCMLRVWLFKWVGGVWRRMCFCPDLVFSSSGSSLFTVRYLQGVLRLSCKKMRLV